MKVSAGLTLLACALTLYAADPNTTSRRIFYHDQDIVPINTEVRYTTLIELPKEETILEVTCGDKEYWPINWTGNLAYIKPAKTGSRTNFNLITASGNVYSFLAAEVSGGTVGAELKIFVQPADAQAIVAMHDKPRFVPASSVEVYEKQAEAAQAKLAAEEAAEGKQLAAEKLKVDAANTSAIRHDYEFKPAYRKPFYITAIWHDDKFTYIEGKPEEVPAVYEIKDGKPSLIQFEYDEKTGRYTIGKILDDGYLRVGKSELRFHRQEGA
jgi:type IV secretion system protein VirB9